MARMKRKQVYIEPEQEIRLKLNAEEQQTTEAEVIREGLTLKTSVMVVRLKASVL